MRDPYSLLGVKRDAGNDEIKAAWRSKAKSVHPDQNRDDPQATARFAEIGQAYDLLKDPAKRGRYDQARRRAEQKQQEATIMQQREAAREAAARAQVAKANADRIMEELVRAKAAGASASGTAHGEKPEDVIDRIFGEPATAKKPQKPETEAPRKTAASPERQGNPDGANNAASTGPQDMRDGTAEPAAEPPAKPPLPLQAFELLTSLVKRLRPGQSGQEKAPDITANASVTIEDLINEGSVIVALPEAREIRLPLEKGMSEGHVVRLKGQGLKVAGMSRGDLSVTIRIRENERFQVHGYDIHTSLPLSLQDAVLGCTVTVEAPCGPVEVEVPAWSGSDRAIRIEAQGLHSGPGTRGDLVVEPRIVLWDKPDEKITDLMRHMREGLFL